MFGKKSKKPDPVLESIEIQEQRVLAILKDPHLPYEDQERATADLKSLYEARKAREEALKAAKDAKRCGINWGSLVEKALPILGWGAMTFLTVKIDRDGWGYGMKKTNEVINKIK